MLNTAEIKRRRERLQMSFMDAAIAAGWSKQAGRVHWYQIESGRRNDVKTTTLVEMAKALKCTPNDILKLS